MERRKNKRRFKAACIVGIGLSIWMAQTAAADGAGWEKIENSWHYRSEDGTYLVSSLTPDGYWVDENGVWNRQTISILDSKIEAAETFCTASNMGDWTAALPAVNEVSQKIHSVLKEKRKFHVYENSIVYNRVSSGKETELLALVKDAQTDGYELRLRTSLGKREDDRSQASTYDYNVFLLFCTLISSRPLELSDAVYSSWQGENVYGLLEDTYVTVRDTKIRYEAEDGAGIYKISAAP